MPPAYAQTNINFQEAQGTGINADTLQIKNMRVDLTIPDPANPAISKNVSSYYNITFRFDPVTLHFVPILESMSANCASFLVRVLNSQTAIPLLTAHVLINGEDKIVDTNGFVQFDNVTSGQQIVTVSAEGFENSYQEITVQCGTNPQVDASLHPITTSTPTTGGEEPVIDTPEPSVPTEEPTPPIIEPPPIVVDVPQLIRIQLDWGETPRDLDAHLTGPEPGLAASYGNDQDRFHLYFANKETSIAKLDTGEFSNTKPEVITIFPAVGAHQLRAGSYRFVVHHFAGAGSITTADTQVRLWIGNQAEQLFTPTIEGANILANASTDVWIVFELLVKEDGTVTVIPIQHYDTGFNPSSVRSAGG